MQEELDVYNALMPGEDEFSATLLIEITDEATMKEWLDRFMGLDHGDTVGIMPAGDRPSGCSKAATVMRPKSVRCISSDSGRPVDDSAFADLHQPVLLTVHHMRVPRRKVSVPGSIREEWLSDLAQLNAVGSSVRPIWSLMYEQDGNCLALDQADRICGSASLYQA